MSDRAEPPRRPGLHDVLREPTAPAALLRAARQRIMAGLRRERRAPRERAAYIRSELPDLASETIAEADRALAGLLVLPGTGARPYFVGDPPDWYANPVNDNEYLWILNRHGHWRSLLAAYTLTEDRRYGEKVVREVRDWIARCPRPALTDDPDEARARFRTVTPWRSLETGIRMFESWPLILEHLADVEHPVDVEHPIDSGLLGSDVFAEFVVSLYEHGEMLAEMTPILFPRANHNMQIMQNLGLLTIATLLPELKTSDAWREHAVRELERGAEVQITDGGGQIEGCPHYHNVCLHYLGRAQLVLGAAGGRFSEAYERRVQAGLDYSTHAFRPSGTGVPWGDSDADLRAVTAALNGGLAFGRWEPFRRIAQLAGREPARRECLKGAWRIPDLPGFLAGFDRLCEPPAADLPTVSWHRTLGQVALRTDWSREALSLFFACHTPTSESGHAHIDPMGFDFTALGRPLVVDPGRYCYRQDDDRRTFKTAAYHNCLLVDHADPYPYLASGRSGRPKQQGIVWVQQEDGLLAAEAVQHNYAPAVHRRAVALVDGAFLLVLDRVDGLRAEQTVQVYYHVDAPEMTWDPDRRAAIGRTAESYNPDVEVAVFAGPGLRGTVLDGRVSDALDVARPSRRLLLEDAAPSPDGAARTYAAVVVPYRAGDPEPAVGGLCLALRDGGLACAFTLAGRPHHLFWSGTGLARTPQAAD